MSASALSYDRAGTPGAPPLLLVHGIGSQKLMWDPVRTSLAAVFDVVAVDLPGFGTSPALPSSADHSARGMAEVLLDFTRSLGWSQLHVCGNSLGGWIALELAAMDAVLSATALSPAGLWRSTPPPWNARAPITVARRAAQLAGPSISLVAAPGVRQLALCALFAKPSRLPAKDAVSHARAFSACPGFEPTRLALHSGRFIEGRGITCPLTVVLPARDPLIVRRQCDLSQLPAHARIETPRGWGHVPTYDDPAGVVRLIRETAGV